MTQDVIPTSASSSDPKIDPLSPFSLANQEGPGQTITHIKLRSDNYEEWRRSMRMSLKSRRKFGFCDGTIAKPTDKFLLDQWEVVHCTVVQWIMHSVDSSIRDSISYSEDASVLWKELEERFSVIDGSKIQSLKAQLNDCKQTKGMTVTTYYGNLKALWEAIAAHEPLLACKCGHCTCGIAKEALARQEMERLHKFFMGLDASLYSTIRSNQLALDPLPSLNRAYQVVLQEERLKARGCSYG
ncbi:uncharacterized protein LOC141613174 [Silene latifolia]|uniref:uncharacterized protein LOC141613174 n=1 Tax=Silene latifolia TaxID=37657 RepID=UPI003D76A6FE